MTTGTRPTKFAAALLFRLSPGKEAQYKKGGKAHD
jgi:hypothetical protein